MVFATEAPNPDQSMAAVSILGYQEKPAIATLHSNLPVQPGQAAVLLNKSTGPEIKALVPRPGDARAPALVEPLHQETPFPWDSAFSHRR